MTIHAAPMRARGAEIQAVRPIQVDGNSLFVFFFTALSYYHVIIVVACTLRALGVDRGAVLNVAVKSFKSSEQFFCKFVILLYLHDLLCMREF